jgi:WXG100 family type VII secretion target
MADTKTIVNYDQLESIGKIFETESQAVENYYRQLRSKADELHGGGWIGRGADKFHDEMTHEVLPAMARLSDALKQTADTIKVVCNIFNAAEEETQGYFRSLGE